MQNTLNFFPDANNISFTNSNPLFQTSFHSVPSGIHVLSQKISTAAMHDSSERFPPPRCHPETRDTAISSIIAFVKSPAGDRPVKWIHAPFGHGKSAVMQSSIETLTEMGLLDHFAGAFFFGRDDPQRNKAHLLLPTIAYQIARNVPGMQEHISAAIIDDPTLPSKSIETQLVPLLVIPFSRWVRPPGLTPTVFIDGLDECGSPSAQRSVLHMVEEAVFTHRLPLRFVVASRPETHITDFFNKQLSSVSQIFKLDDEYEKLFKYLQDGFGRIRLSRPELAIGEEWPSDEVVYRLVHRASGQYLFADTIIRFVESDYDDPRTQLQIILEGHSEQRSAFSPMDSLYTQLLTTIPVHHRDCLLRLLAALVVLEPSDYSGNPSIAALSSFLELDVSVITTILRPLGAVISIEDGLAPLNLPEGITPAALSRFISPAVSVHHISFKEFLVDKLRAQEFWFDHDLMRSKLTCRADYLLSRCFTGSDVEPYIIPEIEKLRQGRRQAPAPFGESFPQFNRQFAAFLRTLRVKPQVPSSAGQPDRISPLLLMRIIELQSRELLDDPPGFSPSRSERDDAFNHLWTSAFEELVNKSPYSVAFFHMIRHLCDYEDRLYASLDTLCKILPAGVVLDVVEDFMPFLDVHVMSAIFCVQVDFKWPLPWILADEARSGHRSHRNFRDARILTVLDNCQSGDSNCLALTSNIRSYPQKFMTLKAHDEDPGSALPLLLEYLCAPPMPESLLASKLLQTRKSLVIFLVFLTRNYQEGTKLKLKVADKLYNLLATFINHDTLPNVFNLDFSQWRRSERYLLLPYLFQEPWRSLMNPRDYTATLIFCLKHYRLKDPEMVPIPWPELFSRAGTSLHDGSTDLENAILCLCKDIHNSLIGDIGFLAWKDNEEILRRDDGARAEVARGKLQLSGSEDLIQGIKAWRQRLILADSQEHQELANAIDYLVDFHRPFNLRFLMPGSYPDSD